MVAVGTDGKANPKFIGPMPFVSDLKTQTFQGLTQFDHRLPGTGGNVRCFHEERQLTYDKEALTGNVTVEQCKLSQRSVGFKHIIRI